MTTFTCQTPLRLIGVLGLTACVAACGGGDVPVRGGPQAVHPSPSALAQGLVAAPTQTTACHSHSGKGCHTHGNDGSQPIID